NPLGCAPIDRVHPKSVARQSPPAGPIGARGRDRARARSYPCAVALPKIAPVPLPEPSAFEQRGAPLLERREVRDVLAWMRLLVDPHDASAVVRALARPPIELRQVHLARVIQVARRRKLDLVSGLAAAIESPQVPPEARERIQRFLAVNESAREGLDALSPEAFMAALIELLGQRVPPLLA